MTSSVAGSSSALVFPEYGPSHPPCLICHGKASGTHYGVNSCNGCKSFFKRFTMRNNSAAITCKYKGACQVESWTSTVNQKRQCAACRYKKCIKVGMTLQAGRPGRITSAERAKITEEVKRLEIQKKITKDGTYVTPDEHVQQMDDIVKLLTNTRLDVLPNTSEKLERMIDKEQQFMDSLEAEESLYGKRSILERAEYNKFYSETGLDIDGRKDLIKKMTTYMPAGIQASFSIVKNIPGYANIPDSDQAKLFRYGFGEMALFLFSHYYNLEDNVVTHMYGDLVMKLENVILFVDESLTREETIERYRRTVKQVQDLDLTVEESTMAAALCIIIPDVTLSPAAQTIVQNSADYLVEILHHEICKNHDPEEHTLAKLLLLLYERRVYDSWNDKSTENFMTDALEVGLPDAMAALFRSSLADPNR